MYKPAAALLSSRFERKMPFSGDIWWERGTFFLSLSLYCFTTFKPFVFSLEAYSNQGCEWIQDNTYAGIRYKRVKNHAAWNINLSRYFIFFLLYICMSGSAHAIQKYPSSRIAFPCKYCRPSLYHSNRKKNSAMQLITLKINEKYPTCFIDSRSLILLIIMQFFSKINNISIYCYVHVVTSQIVK